MDLLFNYAEMGWLEDFSKSVQEKAATRRWTSLLMHFQQLGVDLPKTCCCDWVGDRQSWLHENHAEYNRRVYATITTLGTRKQLHKAMVRMLEGEPVMLNGEKYLPTHPQLLRSHGELLLDFLRAKPKLEWFR